MDILRTARGLTRFGKSVALTHGVINSYVPGTIEHTTGFLKRAMTTDVFNTPRRIADCSIIVKGGRRLE